MISVCIATYNGAEFVERQLRSIICQLNPEDEIVISDDGSNDNTIQIIQAFNDSRIKLFKNTIKPGLIYNFENAIKNAQGEIIFLADQDDIWMNNKIEMHLQYHDSYDLVVSNAIVINDQGEILFESFFNERGSGAGLIKNIIRNSFIGCCMSFNKKIASAALPFPDDIHMHDWWIGLVAELKGNVYFLDKKLMSYIRHSNNASATLIKTLPFGKQFLNRWVLIKNIIILYINGR